MANDRGGLPRPPVAPVVGLALAPFFRAGVALRNASFDRGFRVRRLPIPVVSIGNLSVGGTGKTPMVHWVVGELLEAGRHPAIAMRGYTPRPGSPSDERAEHESRFPGVPVGVGADRVASLSAALARRPETDCAVLDDAFQHRFVARDLDIVLLDATRNPFDDRVLPAGWLREPVSSLRRAHAIVVTHAESAPQEVVADMRRRAAEVSPRALVLSARHDWQALDGFGTESPGADPSRPVSWLDGRRVHVLCAIGNPSAFLAQARAAGAVVVSTDLRRDHAVYSSADVEAARAIAQQQGADAVLTTAKDWAKLAPLAGAHAIPFVRPRLALGFDAGGDALRALLLQACPGARRPTDGAPPRADARRPVLR